MDYLALFARAIQEAGIAGSDPTTVLNQTSRRKKMVDWVSTAWEDIQLMRPNWNFMWKEFSLSTVAANRDYLASSYGISDLALWDTGSFLIYEAAKDENDQNELLHIAYPRWRGEYRRGMGARDDSRPQNFTILPNNQIRFEPRPDKIYTVEGEYKRSTQVFSANTDVPTGLPNDYHMMIVWRALHYYAQRYEMPYSIDEAETKFDDLLFRLEQEELPPFSEDFEALA